jgi:hypothetical protein
MECQIKLVTINLWLTASFDRAMMTNEQSFHRMMRIPLS